MDSGWWARVSYCWRGRLWVNRRRLGYPRGTGLELEALVWAHAYLNMHTGGCRWMGLWICICTQVSTHTYISLLCQLRGPRDIYAPGATSTPSTQGISWFLRLFSNKRSQGSLVKWLILGLVQGLYQMSLEHLIAKKWGSVQQAKKHTMMGSVKWSWSQWKEPPVAKAGNFDQQNKAVLD